MAAAQHYITARPADDGVSSIDTWETLAARASQLGNTQVTAQDLITVNVGGGATSGQVNAWLASIGGALSSDGVNYIFPAGFQVLLPPAVTVPQAGDTAAVAAAVADPQPAEVATRAADTFNFNALAVVAMVAGGVLLFNSIAGSKRHRRHRHHARHRR